MIIKKQSDGKEIELKVSNFLYYLDKVLRLFNYQIIAVYDINKNTILEYKIMKSYL